MGFYLIDELLLKVFVHTLQMKLDKVTSEKEIHVKEEEVVATVQLASDICTARSYRDLLRRMRGTLPKFFGFEAVGILLTDTKHGELFTIAENADTQHQLPNTADQYKAASYIRFPTGIGLTGHVYTTGTSFVSNKISIESRFSSDIDNLTSVGDVVNLIMGPVYGRKQCTREQGIPIGVIQFINKKGFRPISEYDMRRFEAVRGLLGLSIENTADVHMTLNVTLAAKKALS